MVRSNKGLGGVYKTAEGKYTVKVPVGKYPNGKTRYVKRSFDTKREAIHAQSAMIQQRENKELVAGPRTTLMNWCEEVWRNGSDRIEDRTSDGYYRTLKNHVFPVLGKRALKDITSTELQALLSKLRRKYSANTVKNVRVALSAMFTLALKHNMVIVNPVRATELPRRSEYDPTLVKPPWSDEELDAAIMAFEGTNLEMPFMMLVNTGLRLGELLGLRWEDIDWPTHSISIERTISHVSLLQPDGSSIYKVQVRKPKTRTSRRVLQLTSPLIDALRIYQSEYELQAMMKGTEWQNSGYVFVNSVGGPVDESRFRKQFYRVLKQNRVRPIRIHDVRHTFATRLIEKDGGMLPAVSKALGHSTVSITMDVYAKTARIDNQATLAMGEIVYPTRKKNNPLPSTKTPDSLPLIVNEHHKWANRGT